MKIPTIIVTDMDADPGSPFPRHHQRRPFQSPQALDEGTRSSRSDTGLSQFLQVIREEEQANEQPPQFDLGSSHLHANNGNSSDGHTHVAISIHHQTISSIRITPERSIDIHIVGGSQQVPISLGLPSLEQSELRLGQEPATQREEETERNSKDMGQIKNRESSSNAESSKREQSKKRNSSGEVGESRTEKRKCTML